jgi:hypothetical protein
MCKRNPISMSLRTVNFWAGLNDCQELSVVSTNILSPKKMLQYQMQCFVGHSLLGFLNISNTYSLYHYQMYSTLPKFEATHHQHQYRTKRHTNSERSQIRSQISEVTLRTVDKIGISKYYQCRMGSPIGILCNRNITS